MGRNGDSMNTEAKKRLLADARKAALALGPFLDGVDCPHDLSQLRDFPAAWATTLHDGVFTALSGLYILIPQLEAEIGTDNL
jgi:hypothetical protein